MGPNKSRLFLDPTFLLGLSCYISVLFVEGDIKAHSVNFRPLDVKLARKHFADPTVIVSTVLTVAALALTWNTRVDALDSATVRKAGWYLWNACLFHVMDGMVGLGFAPLLGENYDFLDNRLRAVEFSHGGPHPGEASIAHLILMIEIFFMAPMCLLCFVGVIQQRKWAQDAEILLCATHVLGTIIWSIPPLLDDCKSLAPIGIAGCTPSVLSLYNLFYFWFGYGINLLWIFVGTRYLLEAMWSNYKIKTSQGFNKELISPLVDAKDKSAN